MKENKLELIRKTDLFKNLNIEEFEEIIKTCKYKIIEYKKDEYIAFRGDNICGVYINLKGNLVAEMLKNDGNVRKIEELKTGKVIASAFIFGEITRFPVDLVAKTDVEVLFVEKEEVIKLLKNNSKVLTNFLDEISNKAQFLSKNLWESLSNKTINQKLVEFILANEKDNIFLLKQSVKELAEYFNVSRPSLSRVIKFFIEDGIIEKLEKGKYRILSRKKLEEIQ